MHANETVVLLHGLSRTAKSMQKLEQKLTAEGYKVRNIDYPSTKYSIEELAVSIRKEIVERTEAEQPVHFVTHSMGGILVRQIQKANPLPNIGRIVMLAPPNHGSEVVDAIKKNRLLSKLEVPARNQLGTEADGFVAELGPVNFECGILTGDRSINWILSTIIPGPDDGKVSLESAKVEGMQDYKVIHATHPLIMRKASVIKDVIEFLKNGAFTH